MGSAKLEAEEAADLKSAEKGIFMELDKDKSGTLTQVEYLEAHNGQTQAKELMGLLDKNADGKISRAEFEAVEHKDASVIAWVLDHMDKGKE